ncbi:unnamed protein product [Colias eurytheme]|nr:unnamed protein product [Colias eurytheme]
MRASVSRARWEERGGSAQESPRGWLVSYARMTSACDTLAPSSCENAKPSVTNNTSVNSQVVVRYSRESSISMLALVARRPNTLRTFCSSRAVSVRLHTPQRKLVRSCCTRRTSIVLKYARDSTCKQARAPRSADDGELSYNVRDAAARGAGARGVGAAAILWSAAILCAAILCAAILLCRHFVRGAGWGGPRARPGAATRARAGIHCATHNVQRYPTVLTCVCVPVLR